MKCLKKSAAKGFTLIELMIVVAIIGILAAIAIPKFADLVTRSKESSVKGSLGSIRSAVSIYYSDTEGVFPSILADALTASSRYLRAIPTAEIPAVSAQSTPTHTANNGVRAVAAATSIDGTSEATLIWGYVNTGADAGHVAVNCSHKDTKNTLWTAY